jgi:hypothetical protein
MATLLVSEVQPGYGLEPGLSRCCFSISADAAMKKTMKNSNTLLVIISSNRDCQLIGLLPVMLKKRQDYKDYSVAGLPFMKRMIHRAIIFFFKGLASDATPSL